MIIAFSNFGLGFYRMTSPAIIWVFIAGLCLSPAPTSAATSSTINDPVAGKELAQKLRSQVPTAEPARP